MSLHIETRRKIKEIPLASDFESLIQRCNISEKDRQIMRMHYLMEKDFRYIGDTLGYSESTIKKRHAKVLSKLNKIL